MKKFLSLLLVVVMVLSFAACGSTGSGTASNTKTEETAAAYVAPSLPKSDVFEPFAATAFNNGGFNVPGITFEPSKPDTNGTHFEPVEIFKNVWFFGDTWVCCLAFLTDDGDIIMWDALTTKSDMDELVFPDMEKVGLDPSRITKVFLSHGHGDHYGFSGNLQEMYGTEVYFNEADQALIDSSKEKRLAAGETVPTATGYYTDGQTIQTGNFTWTFYFTPGHTAGSTSFVVNVKDFEGNDHKLCCWGGTSAPRDAEGTKTYLNSVQSFRKVIADNNVDCILSMHPFVDYSVELTTAVRESGSSAPIIKTAEEMDFFMQGLYVYATGKGKLATDGITEFTSEGYNCRVLSWPYLVQIPEYDLGIPSIHKDDAVAAEILDDVYLIGNGTDATLVFNSTDGIILIDAMTCQEDFTNTVEPAMKEFGLDPSNIKAVYLTHGQADKYGFASYLADTYKAKIYMSDADKSTAEATYADAVAKGKNTSIPETKNLAEGTVKVGQFEFEWYNTPGHTNGTMSFTVNVTVGGEKHTACLWGGCEYDYKRSALQAYSNSISEFIDVCDKKDVDVLLATNPYFNYSVEKINDMANGNAKAFVQNDENTNVLFALKCIQIATNYKLNYYAVD